MTQDKDERKRPHLRLVVNNLEQRKPRPTGGEDDFISLEVLAANRENYRREFYDGMDRWHVKVFSALEHYLAGKKCAYGLDPMHGKLLVLPVAFICPEITEHCPGQQDEVLIYLSDDTSGLGYCLSFETILPYWSEDEAIMEDVLLYAPIFQYGAMFLEENRQDGLLDLIYRLASPLYPPALTGRLLDRLFAIAAYEVGEALHSLMEYSDG
jgi:hypothetical protein